MGPHGEDFEARPHLIFFHELNLTMLLFTLTCEPRHSLTSKASLSGSFMESFMTLNIINFVDVARREKNEILWDVRRVSSHETHLAQLASFQSRYLCP